MRSKLLVSCLVATLLTSHAFGCAYEGTIAEKRSRQMPDASMIGTEGVHSFVFRGPTGTSRLPVGVPNPNFWTRSSGMYSFLLRDRQGRFYSQMVTAEVFARCQEGDYFNDRGPACVRPDAKDSKNVTTAVIQRRRATAQTRRHPQRRSYRAVAKHRRHHTLNRIAQR